MEIPGRVDTVSIGVSRKHKVQKHYGHWYFYCGICPVVLSRRAWGAAHYAGEQHVLLKHMAGQRFGSE